MFGSVVFIVLFANVISESFYHNQNVPRNPPPFLGHRPKRPNAPRSFRGRLSNSFDENTRPPGIEAADDIGLSIDIQRTYYNGHRGGLITCSQDCEFYFEDGNTIEITCKRKDIGTIQWKDTYGFMRSAIRDNAFKLKISPDAEDVNRNLTCVVYEEEVPKSITVTLVATNINIKTSLRKVQILEIGESWNSSECFGLAYYPTIKSKTGSYLVTKFNEYANHTVIESFDESLEGTMFYCIQYKEVSNTFHSGRGLQEKVFTYERLKTKFIFYLNNGISRNRQTNEVETNKQTENEQVETKMQEESADPAKGYNSDSQSNSAAILGGVLGTIILVLLSIILGILYKSIRQRPPNDGATEAIYTEIAEATAKPKPTAPPPPPRNQNPYITSVDTSKQQAQPKDDEYATIKCGKGTENGDQYSTVERQTVEVKHTSKRQTQLSENLYCIVK